MKTAEFLYAGKGGGLIVKGSSYLSQPGRIKPNLVSQLTGHSITSLEIVG